MPDPSQRAIQVALAIKNVKLAVAHIIEGVAPKAKLYRNYVWDPSDDTWVGLLKSPADVDDEKKKRVHAIQVFHVAIDEQNEQPIRSMDPLIGIGVDFFVAYEKGTDADNSEDRLVEEIAIVKTTLSENSDLGILPAGPLVEVEMEMRKYVMGHDGLRVPKIAMKQFGSHALQYALGQIDVRMQSWRVN